MEVCGLRNSSGSFAMLTAMRRASSRVSSLAAARRPGSWARSLDVGERLPVVIADDSTDQGGGKRRGAGIEAIQCFMRKRRVIDRAALRSTIGWFARLSPAMDKGCFLRHDK
jgi:hypothetical protein